MPLCCKGRFVQYLGHCDLPQTARNCASKICDTAPLRTPARNPQHGLLVCSVGHGAIACRGDPMLPHQFEEYAPRFTTYAGSFGYIAFVIIQGTLDVLAL